MWYVSKEELEQARKIDLLTYLQSAEPDSLLKKLLLSYTWEEIQFTVYLVQER